MAFLSTGSSHHDVALVEVPSLESRGGALHHFTLKVGESVAELAEVQRTLAAAGVKMHITLDHTVSQGIYVSDPDGNLIELYVDADEALWRNDPSSVANSDPLTL